MSQENVEIVRQSLDAFHRRDRAPWLALCDPEIEWFPPAHWPETATIRGPEATWDFMIALNEPWGEGSYELMELVDGTKDKIAARVGRHVRGETSGIAAEFEYWAVFMFRGGKVLRIEWFADRGKALEAVGLRE
jgi:ketosteroid isomerase-like protein